jgi:hypothetical protein
MKTKTYDCVDMIEKTQEELYEVLKNMTVEEEAEYWREETEKLREYQQKMLSKRQGQRKMS